MILKTQNSLDLAAELAALDKTDKATAATKLTDFLKTV